MINIFTYPSREDWSKLQERAMFDDSIIESRVKEIVERVKKDGDKAIFELSKSIDNVELESLQATQRELKLSFGTVASDLKDAMEVAMSNIWKFHSAQIPKEIDIETTQGVRCVQRAIPIERVGLYIPGGSAPLLSTVLMLAIPARVAGCKSITLCTPPRSDGTIAPEILYAASLCGVDNIYKIGGAQAIAAMAYGTETIGKVDKIFGPGNRYVTKAKQMLGLSQVAIDMPAGPSEVMVLADSTSQSNFVASDLLSQVEHGGDSQAILVTNSMDIAKEVQLCVEEQLKGLSREVIASQALDNSKIIVIENESEMIEFANTYASEHLIISMNNPWEIASKITAAGSIFIGNYTPESAGDYASGTNHTLPTAGWAKSFSGVNIDSFVRKVTIQEATKQGLENLGKTITTMAYAEGLTAHAEAVNIRLKEE